MDPEPSDSQENLLTPFLANGLHRGRPQYWSSIQAGHDRLARYPMVVFASINAFPEQEVKIEADLLLVLIDVYLSSGFQDSKNLFPRV